MATDVTIRPMELGDSGAIARVHIASWKETYRGIVPDEFLEGLRMDDRLPMWQRVIEQTSSTDSELPPRAGLVALEENEIVGFAHGGRLRSQGDDRLGEVYALYLLSDHQRQGIGSALFKAICDRLRDLGFGELYVWVLTLNSARTFYEKMGGILTASATVTIGGKDLEEIQYRIPLPSPAES